MFCPACGFKNADGSGFCARCGASLVPGQVDDQTTLSYQPTEDDSETGPMPAVGQEYPTLVIRSGGGRAGESYALREERVTIGRHPAADIFLDDVTVSRNHAVLRREGDEYVLVDEGSLNGTYVNRKRADRSVLADGDEIQIGKYKFTFIMP